MDKVVYSAILAEWGPGGGLARCLAGGADILIYQLPARERIVGWTPAKRVSWTTREAAIVRERYLVEGYALLTALPGRTKDSLRGLAYRLGVQADRPGKRIRGARA